MKKIKINKWNILFLLILTIGIFIRINQFGNIPNGINQDEAYSAYEAYSLANYGVDSHGYKFPVYLTAWGSGMNALQSYLTIPFVKLFGLNTFSARLPALILSILTLIYYYKLIKELTKNNVLSLISLFILAVSPWHIMISRWGLESNLAPGILLIAIYYFVIGIKSNKFYIISSLLFGLALYSYATLWICVPLILICFLIYLLVKKQFFINKYTLLSVIILFVFSLPLILFILINKGYIPEINSFISIPKLLYFRNADYEFSNLILHLKNLIKLLVFSKDGLLWNVYPKYGLYYSIGSLFLCFGFLSTTYLFFKHWLQHKKIELIQVFFIIYLFLIAYSLCFKDINSNRLNYLHLFNIYFISHFIYLLYFKTKPVILIIIISLFSLNFYRFSIDYFTEYNKLAEQAQVFNAGFEKAVQFSMTKGDSIIIDGRIKYIYSILLFSTKIDPTDFINGVNYGNYPAPYLNVNQILYQKNNKFFRFQYNDNPEVNENYVYIFIYYSEIPEEIKNNFSSVQFNDYFVYYLD